MGSNGSTSAPQIMLRDYMFAPNAQKARNLLYACDIPFSICEQPFVMPRPDLADLGITYRRIPVNSIGKDVYCDNSIFLDAVQSIFPAQALAQSPADKAFEQFGYRSFWVALPLVSTKLITPELAKDREHLFAVFSRPDFATLMTNAQGEFKSMLDVVENEFLVNGRWIGGASCSVADIHAIWIIKWVLQTLDTVADEKGFSRQDFPKVYEWIEGLPKHIPENEPEKLDAQEAKSRLLNASYAAKDIGVDDSDPLKLKAGQEVAIETNDDAKPGNAPQHGRLVGLNRREIVIELENSLRLHFPRVGFVAKAL